MISGILYIVSTPIGNLGDITIRAIEILKQVNFIAAEDTRHSKKLLDHFGIKKQMISLHDFNEQQKSKHLIKILEKDKSIALISDAGTPLISDPGYKLIKEVQKNNIKIIPIPGVCAAITALSVSGLPTDKFTFEGFLSAKIAARKNRLEEVKNEKRTLIFYESPHRLLAMLNDLLQIFGKDRLVVLAKELTKKFETVFAAKIPEIINWLSDNEEKQKGEFVILVHGAEKEKKEINSEVIRILNILKKELPPSKASAIAAKITGISRKDLYGL